jgi:hypothetical protein
MSDARRIYAVGASGFGKSTLMDQMAAPSPRLIVFDYLTAPGARKRQRRLKLTHVTTVTQIRNAMATGKNFRLWYQPPIDEQVQALHELSMLIWRAQHLAGFPALTLYVDEIADSFPVYALPTDQRGFYRLCKAGRHIGVNVLAASQKPAQVNTELRGNLDAFYAFRLTTEADLKAVHAIGGRALSDFCRKAPRYKYARLGEAGQLSYGVTRS